MQITTPTAMEAELRHITSDGCPGRYPNSATVLGRKVLMHHHGRWVGVSGCQQTIGLAARMLELIGFDWRNISSPEDVVAKAEAIRTLAAQPIVVEHGLPIKWLVGVDGDLLGIDGLSAIAQAIELAERVNEDWRQWIYTTTAVDVLVRELPRLQTKAEAKTERKALPKGVRKAIARAKSNGDWDEVRRLGGIIPAHVLEARKAAELAKAKPAALTLAIPTKAETTHAIAPPEPLKPGTVIDKDGVPHVVCTGRHGSCLALVPVDKALVAKSLGSVMHALGIRRYEDLNEGNLMKISFCETCGPHILLGGCQTVPVALEAKARKIAEAEAYQAKLAAEREAAHRAEEFRREKLKRVRNNGAFGNPSNPRPAKYLAKKAAKAARSRAEMVKGATGGGGHSHHSKNGR